MQQKETIIKPSPIADAKLTVKILDLLQQALNYKQLKKGANEVLKILDKGLCELVILAADTDPIEIVMNIPGKCEEKVIFTNILNHQNSSHFRESLWNQKTCSSSSYNLIGGFITQLYDIRNQRLC
ncbi:hypothetical protein pb186bvf_002415 [Paramecium bursaria]